ncbi:TlpA family protein disulfide reductase [Pedobacter hartonius]|uniref:Thiol-disulfide isomerase or thioredoxin n=1 Tax=Pedobacter hartonius TaxID=425514 RepID=A0A1H4H5S6_9SPHI|nr:TlpA disulfide reductase family protein [Pedobacter hartonius]SEB17119.1 Thiol-disulfide isomerase or thioredoxin [Pedobacter hartonius]
MNIKLPFFLIISAALISYSSHDKPGRPSLGEAGTVVVSVALKSHESLVFNSFDRYSRKYEFKNYIEKDTLITRQIKLSRPALWQYGNFLVLPTGPVLKIYSLLLLPGDTVLLKGINDGAIAMTKSSGYQKLLDSLITLPKEFYWYDAKSQQILVKDSGIKQFLQSIENTFSQNENRIDRLNVSALRSDWIRKVNKNIKYTAIAHLLQNKEINSSTVMDSVYKEMYADVNDILAVDAINNNVIMGAIVSYNAKKNDQNLNKDNFWATAAGVDTVLRKTALYKDYLKSAMEAQYINAPKEIMTIRQQLADISSRSPFLDTLYQVSGILAETFKDYSGAKQKLQNYAGGHYAYIMDADNQADNHEIKPTKYLPPILLYDFAGKKADFKQVVASNDYKLTLVDFWASWCIPCIMEMPALKRAEEKMKGKPIKFVTISIDKDQDISKWITAAKQNKLYGKAFQYRLANFKQSPLTKLIHIRNIPRYLLIDQQGNIIDDDFYRPSDERFQLQLMKHLD